MYLIIFHGSVGIRRSLQFLFRRSQVDGERFGVKCGPKKALKCHACPWIAIVKRIRVANSVYVKLKRSAASKKNPVGKKGAADAICYERE